MLCHGTKPKPERYISGRKENEMHKIKVIIKEPGKKPRSTNISASLENLQKTVGGYIEMVRLTADCVVLCDEDGRRKHNQYTCNICGHNFVGTIILCGTAGEEFADIPIDFQDAKRMFPNLWEVEDHDD